MALIEAGLDLHCLRDLTRGGLATALVEIAQSAGLEILVRESAIPVQNEVRGACELLGLDPLYVANEGRFIAFLPADQADRALEILRRRPVGAGAVLIGAVEKPGRGLVKLRNPFGSTRILDRLSGEQLPRIC